MPILWDRETIGGFPQPRVFTAPGGVYPFRGAIAECRGHASGGGNGKVVYIDTEGTLCALPSCKLAQPKQLNGTQ